MTLTICPVETSLDLQWMLQTGCDVEHCVKKLGLDDDREGLACLRCDS